MAEQPQQLPHDDDEHGEGNRAADRRYREGVKKTLSEKDVEKLAEEAREALESDGDELRAAEAEGKRHAAEEDRLLYKKGGGERS